MAIGRIRKWSLLGVLLFASWITYYFLTEYPSSQAEGNERVAAKHSQYTRPTGRNVPGTEKANPSNAKAGKPSDPANDSEVLKAFRIGKVALLDADWILTSPAIETLGLSEQEASAAQVVITRVRQELMREAQSHLQVDALRGGPDQPAFVIKPFAETGQKIKDAMFKDIEAIIGADRAGSFSQAVPRFNFAGDFGTLEVQIKIDHSELADDKTGFGVRFATIRPESGRRFGAGSIPLSMIESYLGVKLEIAGN